MTLAVISARRIALAAGLLGILSGVARAEQGDRVRDHLYAASFVDAARGWAVGAFGTILHTGDGGGTWTVQISGTYEPLFAVDFVDARTGWAVGRSGIILHTADGGALWRAQPSGVEDKHLFDVDFSDPQHGVAVGDWGTILLTRDGGLSWEVRSLARDVILNAVQLVDGDHGWIVGEAGTMLSTADGGRTWRELPAAVDKTLFGLHFADAAHGWAVGVDALILQTDDGGAVWRAVHGSTEAAQLDQVGFAQAYDYPSLYAVAVRGGVGFAVGDLGAIFTSRDGGLSWARERVPAEWGLRWFRDVALTDGASGQIVGAEALRIPIHDARLELPADVAPTSR